MSWMSARANALVDAARPAMSLDAARAARMRARVMAATGVAAGAAAVTVVAKGAATAASASASAAAPATSAGAVGSAAAATKAGLGAKLALIVLGAAAVAAGTHVVDRMMMSGANAPAPIEMRAATPAIAPAPRVVLAPSLVAVPMPFAVPAHARARASVSNAISLAGEPAARPTPRAVSADDRALLDETPPAFDQGADALARELSQVRGARDALAAGDGVTALLALDAHDRDFPAGQLAEEAGVLRVEALCAVGRTIDAADARVAFLARFPRSAQRARAARACGGGEGP